MGFTFKPELRFVCKSCRQVFPNVDKLIDHKLQSHLGDCLKTKAIIFEEKLEYHETASNGLSIPKQEKVPFRNPYVSLKQLGKQKGVEATNPVNKIGLADVKIEQKKESMQSRNSRARKSTSKGPPSKGVSLPSASRSKPIWNRNLKPKLIEKSNSASLASPCRSIPILRQYPKSKLVGKLNSTPSWVANTANNKQSNPVQPPTQVKVEPEASNLPSPSDRSTINKHKSISQNAQSNNNRVENIVIKTEKEDPIGIKITSITSLAPTNSKTPKKTSQEKPVLENREFIVASVGTNPNGSGKIRFVSTMIPTSDQEFKFLTQRKAYPTITDPPRILNTSKNTSKTSVGIELNNTDGVFNDTEKVEFMDSDLLPSSLLEQLLATPMPVTANETLPGIFDGVRDLLGESVDPLLTNEPTATTSNPISKPFMCEVCFGFFRNKAELSRHKLSHSTERPFKCGYCPATYKTRQNLHGHLIIHGRVTNIQCSICNKSFHTNSQRNDHERTHTGDRPFLCQVVNCSLTFRTKSGLNNHKRLKHCQELGLQQFVCPTCGKCFGLRSYWKKHLETHATTNPVFTSA